MGKLWMIDEGNPGKGARLARILGRLVREGAASTRSVGGRRRIAGARSASRGLGLLGQSRQPACFHIERVDGRANVQGRTDPSRFGRDVERRLLAQPADPLAALVAIRCDDPQRLCWTLPLAETLNRFFIPLWVFSLGMIDTSCPVLTVVSTEALAAP